MRYWVAFAVLILGAACWQFTPDDTYISAVYARNLPHLGMNPGQVYEGYVCPLWLPVCRGGVEAAKLASMAAAGLCVALWPILAAIPWMPMHAVSGMETALAMLLAGLAVMLYRRRRWGLAALALLGLSLCRPEMALLAPLLLTRREARPAAIGYFLAFGAYWALRWWYFGAFLPAPISAKLDGAPPFNYGYRYFMPALAALAAAVRLRPAHVVMAMLLTAPLTYRAISKATDYAESLERGYGAVAELVQREQVQTLQIDTPGLVAYRTGVSIIDPNGIAASPEGTADMVVAISPDGGDYWVKDGYWLTVLKSGHAEE